MAGDPGSIPGKSDYFVFFLSFFRGPSKLRLLKLEHTHNDTMWYAILLASHDPRFQVLFIVYISLEREQDSVVFFLF